MAGYQTPTWTNGGNPPINATNLIAMGLAIESAQHPYGVCTTAASTQAKTVSVDYSGTLALFTGLVVRVKFSSVNNASSPTLNVNSTGAVPIMSYGTTNASGGEWMAGEVVTFVYDGTNWVVINGAMSHQTVLVTISNISQLPYTTSCTAITAQHVAVGASFSNPSAQVGAWSVSTGYNTFTISGTMPANTTTNLTLIFAKYGQTFSY